MVSAFSLSQHTDMNANYFKKSHNRTMSDGTFDVSTICTVETEEYKRLNDIIAAPEQLAFFRTFLQNRHAHENLLFIEALSQLRHEKKTSHIEDIVNRIWKTFFADYAPFQLEVKGKDDIEQFIQTLKWDIVLKREALEVFQEAETQVKRFLNVKLTEFDKIYNPDTKTVFQVPITNKHQKRVVIVGGGFTGFTVASILDPMPRFHVTLIDTKDSFEYTPGMIKLLVRPEETSSLRVRHDAYINNGRVIIGYAEQILDEATSIKVNNEYIPFDYLVLATGSTYQSKLKSFDTSSLYRLSELASEHAELMKAKSVLIIGGGLVGCELASEIATHNYPAPYDQKKKITLVDSHASLVRRSSTKRKVNAMNYFERLGVDVVLNEKIIDFDSAYTNSYLGSSGASYSGYDKVFLATGTTPCSDVLRGNGDAGFDSCIDHWGRLRVKPTLQLDHWKYNHIFAGGDVTDVVEEKTGYAATLAGVCIARNISRLERGKQALKQGSKGTLPAPSKPLHGIKALGGVGRQHLNGFKKTFAFLNPTWAALKYFDENEFLNIVQGEAKLTTVAAIGKKPKVLNLPKSYYRNNAINADNSDTCSTFSFNSFIKQQTNFRPQLHKKKSMSSLSPSCGAGQEHIRTHDSHLRVSTTNLSGSDILSCSTNTSEISFLKCDNELPDPCDAFNGNTTTTTTTPESNALVWRTDELSPRPPNRFLF